MHARIINLNTQNVWARARIQKNFWIRDILPSRITHLPIKAIFNSTSSLHPSHSAFIFDALSWEDQRIVKRGLGIKVLHSAQVRFACYRQLLKRARFETRLTSAWPIFKRNHSFFLDFEKSWFWDMCASLLWAKLSKRLYHGNRIYCR